jgi:hypothetical protein
MQEGRLGGMSMAEAAFLLGRQPDRVRAPDFAFVRCRPRDCPGRTGTRAGAC